MLNPALTWRKATIKKAVSVRNGVVHALSCGEANITVRTVDTGRTACCHITVLNDENAQAESSDQIHAVQELTVGEIPLLFPPEAGKYAGAAKTGMWLM